MSAAPPPGARCSADAPVPAGVSADNAASTPRRCWRPARGAQEALAARAGRPRRPAREIRCASAAAAITRVAEFRHRRSARTGVTAGKCHRRARVEHDRRRHVRRLAKLLGVERDRSARRSFQSTYFEIVAGTVVAVLAELGAVAVKRAAMQPGHEPFDDDARDQLEVGDARPALRADRRRADRVNSQLQLGSRTLSSNAWLNASQGRDGFEQPRDDLIGVDAVGLGLEVQQDAMAQHRQRDGADVVERRRRCGRRAARAPWRRAPAPGRRADRRPTSPTAAPAPARASPASPAGRLARTMRSA